MASVAREVVQDHMEAALVGDVDRIMSKYADDAVLFDIQGNSHRGYDAIRGVFVEVLQWSLDLHPETEIHEDGNVVFVTWRARRDGEADLVGTDTFVIEGGCIAIHTGFIVEATQAAAR